jgi:hypothetical protein
MDKVEKPVCELICSSNKRNDLEVVYWKGIFLERKPIPLPFINKNNEVIAFFNCFFAISDLGVQKTWCVEKI